jgi:toxin YoeB
VKGLAESPIPRKKTDYGDAYVKIVRSYLIIFEEDNSTIYILSIWDTRQDPNKLRRLLE